MKSEDLLVYHFAVLRAVPHVHRGEFANVGVVMHARTAEYLDMRAVTDPAALRALVPDADVELLARYLVTHERITRGDPACGPVSLLPPSERFHWLSAPRSDLLQTSPVHEGLTDNPARTLDELFGEFVRSASAGDPARDGVNG
jgi:hypothetical protein